MMSECSLNTPNGMILGRLTEPRSLILLEPATPHPRTTPPPTGATTSSTSRSPTPAPEYDRDRPLRALGGTGDRCPVRRQVSGAHQPAGAATPDIGSVGPASSDGQFLLRIGH